MAAPAVASRGTAEARQLWSATQSSGRCGTLEHELVRESNDVTRDLRRGEDGLVEVGAWQVKAELAPNLLRRPLKKGERNLFEVHCSVGKDGGKQVGERSGDEGTQRH